MTPPACPPRSARFFAAPLAETDPALADRTRRRAPPPAGRHRADRQREHRLRAPCSRRRARCSPTNTPRAIPAAATMAAAAKSTWPRAWRSSAPRRCSIRRLRQRAAAFGCPGQRRGVPGAAQPGRHAARHVARRRRPPDAWRRPQPHGQMVPLGPVRRPPRRRPARLRGARAPRPHRAPEADHRRRLRLSADHRLRPDPRGRRRGGRAVHGRHGPFRGAGRDPASTPARCRTRMS